jgi:HYR domain
MKVLAVFSFTAILFLSNIAGNTQSCTLNCPPNIIVKTDNGMEGALVSFPPVASLGAGECGTITYSKPNGSFFRIGSHSIIVTSSSGEKCAFTVTVTDNESPQLSELTLSAKRVWPPSNKMKRVAVYYTSSDNAKSVITELSVQSNNTELTNKDYEVINNHMIRLKASRLPTGETRIYTIVVTSTDEAGNRTRRATSIAVSKTMGLAYTNSTASSLTNQED